MTTLEPTRQRGMRAIDLHMRRDGYVTATEVANAFGVSLPFVHKGIKNGRIPGRRATGAAFGERARWYVDIRALLRTLGKDAPSEVRTALEVLAELVPRNKRR